MNLQLLVIILSIGLLFTAAVMRSVQVATRLPPRRPCHDLEHTRLKQIGAVP